MFKKLHLTENRFHFEREQQKEIFYETKQFFRLIEKQNGRIIAETI
jgi:hypothetical protein